MRLTSLRPLLLWCCLAFACAADPAFTLRITTDIAGASASNQFTLPLHAGSTYDFTVAWGDGASQDVTSDSSPTHTYATPGTYTVRITERSVGGFPRIECDSSLDREKIVALTNWGDVHWSSLSFAFAGCSNMVITATDHATAHTGTVTDFSYAWVNCTSMAWFPPLDTHAAITLEGAWAGCEALTAFPNIDTSSVTNFNEVWHGCHNLSSFPRLNTSNGTTFQGAWLECRSLRSFPSIDTTSATDIQAAWFGCSALTSFPVLNTASVTVFNSAWSDCVGLRSFPQLNTSAGTQFSGAWWGCSKLTDFPAIDTSHGTHFGHAWDGCTSLLDFPLLDLRSMQDGSDCFEDVQLPGDVYSDLLIDLATHNSNTGVRFDGGRSCYDTTAASARNDTLVTARSWIIDDAGPETAPVITCATSASATKGTAFSFVVTTAPRARTYSASGLPAGLTLNASNGLISGTPTDSGTFQVGLAVTNTVGSDTATLRLDVDSGSHGSTGTDDDDGLLTTPNCGSGLAASLILCCGVLLLRRRDR